MKPSTVLGLSLFAAAAMMPAAAQAQIFTLSKDQMIELTAQNPFERFPDGRPKVPDALIQRARGLSAEEVFAVLPKEGFRNQYAGDFRVLHPGDEAGRARVHAAVHAPAARPRDRHQRPREGGRSAAHVQPDRDRHAAARGRPGGGPVRPGGRRDHRRRQPLLLHHADHEERRPGGGRAIRDLEGIRWTCRPHPGRASERHQQRDHQRHQRARAHRQGASCRSTSSSATPTASTSSRPPSSRRSGPRTRCTSRRVDAQEVRRGQYNPEIYGGSRRSARRTRSKASDGHRRGREPQRCPDDR